jgi:hypothetical protein
VHRRFALLGAAALGAVAFATPGLAGPEYKNHEGGQAPVIRSCEDGDEVTFAGDSLLWPPNHKASPYTVTADGAGEDGDQQAADDEDYDDDGEDVSIETAGSNDEFINGQEAQGSGKPNGGADNPPAELAGPSPDQATTASSVTAERAGTGDGRVYTIDWTATFDDGTKICTSQVPAEGDQEMGKTYVKRDAFQIVVPHDHADI